MIDHVALEDLSAFLDAALPVPRLDQVEAHLATCEACRRECDALSWAVRFARALPETPVPLGASFHVPRAVQDRHTPEWPRSLRGASIVALAAAAVLVVAFGALLGPRLLGRRLALGPSSGGRAVDVQLEGGVGTDRGATNAADRSAADRAVALTPTVLWDIIERGAAPTVDSRRAGYPAPLATEREREARDEGAVEPPPEVGGLAPRLTSTETAAATPRPIGGEGVAATSEADGLAATLRPPAAPASTGSESAGTGPAASESGGAGSDAAMFTGTAFPGSASAGATSRVVVSGSAARAPTWSTDTIPAAAAPSGAASGAVRASKAALAATPSPERATTVSPAEPSPHGGAGPEAPTPPPQAAGTRDAHMPSGHPIPWTPVAGLAATLLGLGALLLARSRRARR